MLWKHPEHDILVCPSGRIYRMDGTEINQFEIPPYLAVSVNGKSVRVHRLVLETFKGYPPDKWVAHHINKVRHDNRLDNLEWLPRGYHMQKHSKANWKRWIRKGIRKLNPFIHKPVPKRPWRNPANIYFVCMLGCNVQEAAELLNCSTRTFIIWATKFGYYNPQRIFTEIHKANISKKKSGKGFTSTHRENISKGNRDKGHSKGHREKIRQALKGNSNAKKYKGWH